MQSFIMPTTVKGYMSLYYELENESVTELKGFDKLSVELQFKMRLLDNDFSNGFNEILALYEEENKQKD